MAHPWATSNFFPRRITRSSMAGLANGAASYDTKWILGVLMWGGNPQCNCDLWHLDITRCKRYPFDLASTKSNHTMIVTFGCMVLDVHPYAVQPGRNG